ncbi:MAG: PepSY-associated TM helix domain-containing protein [Dokdonella sp.]
MSPRETSQAAPDLPSRQRRAWWLKTLHNWHWISSALCLIGMIAFSVTGITLNHASQIPAQPVVETRSAVLPPELTSLLATGHVAGESEPLPAPVAAWLSKTLRVAVANRAAEWSSDEVYVALPTPGGDGWLSIQRSDGAIELERTDRGWIAYFNDLHKGRNTGAWWSWFIDIFALACLLFSITGLLLLHLHARHRAATWPIVGLGLAIPLILALLSIH